jgi:diphthamide synthase (EF-2-diphthine--ammonia ligase)
MYEARFLDVAGEAAASGITHIAFGDLYLADVRQYREQLLVHSGVEPLFPLFGSATRDLAHAIVQSGLKAVVTCVDHAISTRASSAGRSP